MPEPTPRGPVTGGLAGQFLLEIVGLVGIARLGWHLGEAGPRQIVLAIFFTALAGAIWGVCRTAGFVPSGRGPVVPVPGPVRLGIEFLFFAAAAWGLWISGWNIASMVMMTGTVIVYWTLRDRTMGLLRNRRPPTGNA